MCKMLEKDEELEKSLEKDTEENLEKEEME